VFGGQLNKLQQERNDLVHLVSSGQEIMADLVKENEELEQQLTLHLTSHKKSLMGQEGHAEENGTTKYSLVIPNLRDSGMKDTG